MIYNELPISFPWYDKIEKQNRYNEHSNVTCDYKLISPKNGLLPFQFYKSTPGGTMPTLWEVREINTNNLVTTLTLQIGANINRSVRDGKEYFTYYGGVITGLNLAAGYYYSTLAWADNSRFYSEMFHIPPEFSFTIGQANEFIKLTWYNNNDLIPVFYNDKAGDGLPKFKQVVYLDSFIHASEPELTEDGTRDGNDELIPTFQKLTITYRISVVVPDFLKKCFHVLPLHDYVELTTQNGIRTGTAQKLKINSSLEAGGALSVVDILFQEDLIIKKGCGENMASS